ncbi:hypothetical protein ACJRO7_017380 [Eucalyptus globulus]|uniref:(+)-delta-cadinene synthase n=1 Tax=Eucalyptus globulus TaxID=34317 RepID=A0ABD3KRX5_EUCGL
MVELARASSLKVVFPESVDRALADLFINRRQILEREELVDKNQYCPLLSYLEALPSTYKISHETILKHLDSDGSLFQSPSATSRAYLSTGNEACLAYLQSLASNCASSGIPSLYPVDEDLTKLSLVHQLVRLGLTEYFDRENDESLAKIYRNYKHEKQITKSIHSIAAELYKDCLQFWLLRMHGYRVSPSSFCWFLDHEEVRDHIEKHYEYFSSVLLYIYRASNLMLPDEYELEKARIFSKKFLEKIASRETRDSSIISSSHCRMIEHELGLPWMARRDHLEHRTWMEEKDACVLWMGKFPYNRPSFVHNQDIVQLALQNYVLRQSAYRMELGVVKRWSETTGLRKMGFGRKKTLHSYFAVAASISLPCNSDVRVLVAKSAIMITVADDFFDMEGSLEDLEKLTNAVQRAKSGRCSLSGACSLLLLLWTYIHSLIFSPCFYDFLTIQKEEKQWKLNFVLLYLKENPEASIEDSINFVQLLLEQLKKEFLLHVLEELCNLPEPSRRLHLGCLKVFHMFFNSSNRYDSETGMLHDIQKALVVPLRVPKLKPLRPLLEQLGPKPREFVTKSLYGQVGLERFPRKSFVGYRISSRTGPVDRWEKMYKSSNFKLCFA